MRHRLVVTVYAEDDRSVRHLEKADRMVLTTALSALRTSDNFWAMGDTGPCGPCSEIFFDHGDHIWGGPPGSPEEDGDRFVEIWNLVFMQFEQRGPDDRIELPKPSIDTGMGLERIAAVLQGTHDNYETDLFRTLIAASVEATGVAAEGEQKASHRVIADHLRASSFLIADGVLPSNEGRGYVLRRIMRRAMRHAHLLGAADPLVYKLVPTLLREMGDTYSELRRAEALITETLKLEETRFRKTLARGLQLLDEATDGMSEGDELAGEVAFKLYDTYGFPLDLTEDALRARDIGVDTDGFAAAMERQKAEARAAWSGSGEAATETVWLDLREAHGATEFLGYGTETAEGEVLAVVRDGKPVKQLKKGDEGAVILNQTPFYGESGGQVGDRGVIRIGPKALFEVTDTQKKAGDLFVHFGKVVSGPVKPGVPAVLEVDQARRSATRANHSATHLIHEALRMVLGDHVAQKGSLVSPDRLRFDISHPKPIDANELFAVERIANAMILQNEAVTTRLMDIESAMETGAMALFGEKYGDEVRVVSMGTALEGPKFGRPYSVELCGGTHVARTGDIGIVRIVGESAVAAGVRRIEALTGDAARIYLAEQDERVRAAADLLRARPEDVFSRLVALLDERKKLEKQLADAKKQLALAGPASAGGAGDAAASVETIGSVKLMARTLPASPRKTCAVSRTTRNPSSAQASLLSSPFPRTARPPLWSVSPPI